MKIQIQNNLYLNKVLKVECDNYTYDTEQLALSVIKF